MKNSKSLCLVIILVLVMVLNLLGNDNVVLANNTNSDDGLIIVLDAGHNYKETYKCSPDTYMEVNFTLAITKKVKECLERDNPNVTIIESNPDGWDLGRGDRGKFALDLGADLLFSLHMDTYGKDWQTENIGTHIIVDNHSDYETHRIAKSIVKTYSDLTRIPFARKEGFDIRSDGKNQISMLDVASKGGLHAMLLEMTFMDNKEQAVKFKQEDYQWFIAECISKSITDNFINIYSNTTNIEIGVEPEPIESLQETEIIDTIPNNSNTNNSSILADTYLSWLLDYIDLYEKVKVELDEANRQLKEIEESQYNGLKVIQN